MDKKITEKQLRKFGLLISFGFPIILGILIPKIFGHSIREWTIWIGLIALFFVIFRPSLLVYPYKFWMFIGFVLGWFNSKLILGLVYILVLLPISFIMNLFGYDPLKKKINDQKSYKETKLNYRIDMNKIF